MLKYYYKKAMLKKLLKRLIQAILCNKAFNIFIFIFLLLSVSAMSSAFVLRVFVDPPVDPTIDGSIKKIAAEEIIQLNILNACDIPNLAGIARKYMRIRGFDVVEIGNHPDFSDKSFVIDRVGDLSSAKKVAYAFGISDSLIVQHIDSSLFLRSSVVIGKDFKNLRPFEE